MHLQYQEQRASLFFQNTIETIEMAYLKASYDFGQTLDLEKNPVRARLQALAIPLICFLGETIKVVSDVKRIALAGYLSLKTCSLRTGNARMIVLHIAEHMRYVAGIVTGVFFALYSPSLARKLFLTEKAGKLQRKLSPDMASKLYAVIYGVCSFLQKHKIDYRICHGTLLGAVRHKGIVPWDDDADLMIHPSSIDKCKRLLEEGVFEKETGLVCKNQSFTGGWECFHPDSPKGEGPLKEIGYPFIDIFFTEFDKDMDRIIISSKMMQQLFTEEYVTTQEWNDPKTYTLGPVQVASLEKAIPYLERRYGSGFLEFACQVPHHDALASLTEEPWNFPKHIQTILQYDLPRRVYLEDKVPVEYDHQAYTKYISSIDRLLQRS